MVEEGGKKEIFGQVKSDFLICIFQVLELSTVTSFLINRTTEQQQSYCDDLVSLLGSLQPPSVPNCDFELLKIVEISDSSQLCIASQNT